MSTYTHIYLDYRLTTYNCCLQEVKHPGEEMSLPFRGKYSGDGEEEEDQEDDDIIQISQRVSLICPLTTMLMEDPVTKYVIIMIYIIMNN